MNNLKTLFGIIVGMLMSQGMTADELRVSLDAAIRGGKIGVQLAKEFGFNE